MNAEPAPGGEDARGGGASRGGEVPRGGEPRGRDPREGVPRGGDPRGGVPPRGEPPPPPGGRSFDPAALFVLLDGIRRAAPRELQDQVTKLIRDFLLTLRSLIDWYLDRLDHPPREPEVEDIPIE